MPHLSRRAAGTLILLLAGCQGSSGPLAPPDEPPPQGPPAPRAARIAAASPTAFALLPGEAVPIAPAVTVTNAEGEGLPNIPVRFTVLGGGYVAQTTVLSNSHGGATTSWVLGMHHGINILLASVGDLPAVVFVAEGGFESTAESYGLMTSNQQATPTPGVAGGALLLYGNGTFTQYHVLGARVDLANPRGIAGSYVRNGRAITFSGAGASWAGTITGDTVLVDGHEGWEPASYVLMSSVTECAPESVAPSGGGGVIYTRVAPHRYPRGALSSFELRPDSTFYFQFTDGVNYGIGGRFTRSGATLNFAFNGWNGMGPWYATGTTRGRSLTVVFNEAMSYEFEDGVYATPLCSAAGAATNSR